MATKVTSENGRRLLTVRRELVLVRSVMRYARARRNTIAQALEIEPDNRQVEASLFEAQRNLENLQARAASLRDAEAFLAGRVPEARKNTV